MSATELSKRLAELARYHSTRGGAFPETVVSCLVSKEKGDDDFDEYGWANIGSFDEISIECSGFLTSKIITTNDELWSSSKDVFNSPSKTVPSILNSEDLGFDIRTEFEQQENQQFPLTGKANGPSSQSVRVTPKSEQFHEHKGQASLEDHLLRTADCCTLLTRL
ncbi:dentin sialophosphoprotein-related [Raphanus sativus]|nr:dentin sialophosphoprotein-related [Raphanus sativus]